MSKPLEGIIGIGVSTGLAALADYLGCIDGPSGYKTFENSLFFNVALGSGAYAGLTKNAGAALAGVAFSLIPALFDVGKYICAPSSQQNSNYADIFLQSLSTPALLQTLATVAAGYVAGASARLLIGKGGSNNESS